MVTLSSWPTAWGLVQVVNWFSSTPTIPKQRDSNKTRLLQQMIEILFKYRWTTDSPWIKNLTNHQSTWTLKVVTVLEKQNLPIKVITSRPEQEIRVAGSINACLEWAIITSWTTLDLYLLVKIRIEKSILKKFSKIGWLPKSHKMSNSSILNSLNLNANLWQLRREAPCLETWSDLMLNNRKLAFVNPYKTI